MFGWGKKSRVVDSVFCNKDEIGEKYQELDKKYNKFKLIKLVYDPITNEYEIVFSYSL